MEWCGRNYRTAEEHNYYVGKRYLDRISETWSQLISCLTSMDWDNIDLDNVVLEWIELTDHQILLILSMQNNVKRVSENEWMVRGKKKRGWKLDLKKFQEKIFDKMGK